MKTYKTNKTAEIFQAYVDAAESVEHLKERESLYKAALEHEIRTSPLIYPGDVEETVQETLAKNSGISIFIKNAEEKEIVAQRNLRETLAKHGVPLEKLDNDAIRSAVGAAMATIFPLNFKDLSVADFSAFTRAVARFASDRTKTGTLEIENEARNLIEVKQNAELEEWLKGDGKPDYITDIEDIEEDAALNGLEVEEVIL